MTSTNTAQNFSITTNTLYLTINDLNEEYINQSLEDNQTQSLEQIKIICDEIETEFQSQLQNQSYSLEISFENYKSFSEFSSLNFFEEKQEKQQKVNDEEEFFICSEDNLIEIGINKNNFIDNKGQQPVKKKNENIIKQIRVFKSLKGINQDLDQHQTLSLQKIEIAYEQKEIELQYQLEDYQSQNFSFEISFEDYKSFSEFPSLHIEKEEEEQESQQQIQQQMVDDEEKFSIWSDNRFIEVNINTNDLIDNNHSETINNQNQQQQFPQLKLNLPNQSCELQYFQI
ncbi:hypothetical protein ABPG72_019870 [Tetrahymena utriculariae]